MSKQQAGSQCRWFGGKDSEGVLGRIGFGKGEVLEEGFPSFFALTIAPS